MNESSFYLRELQGEGQSPAGNIIPALTPRPEDRSIAQRLARECLISPEGETYFSLTLTLEILVSMVKFFRQHLKEGRDIFTQLYANLTAWPDNLDQVAPLAGVSDEQLAHIKRVMRRYIDESTADDKSYISGYDINTMEGKTAILSIVAAHFSLPVEVASKVLKDAAVNAAREATARAEAEPRLDDAAEETTVKPVPSDGPEWPSEKWKGSPEELSRRPFAIEAFLRRVWKPFIDETGALVTRQMVMARDPDAGLALKGFLRGGRQMPGDIRIVRTRDLKHAVGDQSIIYRMV